MKVTKESIASAVRVFEQKFTLTPEYITSAFAAALDALFIEDEGEGWVEETRPELHNARFRFINNKYQLIMWDRWCWKIYPIDALTLNMETQIAQGDINMSPSQAQAWADAEIEKYEGEQKIKSLCFKLGDRVKLKSREELTCPSWKEQEIGIGTIEQIYDHPGYTDCAIRWADGSENGYKLSDLIKIDEKAPPWLDDWM